MKIEDFILMRLRTYERTFCQRIPKLEFVINDFDQYRNSVHCHFEHNFLWGFANFIAVDCLPPESSSLMVFYQPMVDWVLKLNLLLV